MQQLSFVPYLHFYSSSFTRHELNECIRKWLILPMIMHCSLVDAQISVGLWDSINPYDILLTYLNGWTQSWIYFLLGLIDSIHHGGQACSEGMTLSETFNLWMYMLCYEPTEWFVESWMSFCCLRLTMIFAYPGNPSQSGLWDAWCRIQY
jgi:hypothetical protein